MNFILENDIIYLAQKDLLTKYGNQTVTYDAQGNPTSYLGHTLTWEKGRQLKSFDGNTYTYNANGIRTSKTVNGVKHTYTLDGTKILSETWDSNTLIPLYDNEESVCGIVFNNEPFYFQKNLQGDIIAVVNKDAQVVVKYSYDAWGVCTVTQDTSGCSIATVNPFRYRGYYYDEEIGLYYLQSRYYDPVVGRFVNVDIPEIVCNVAVLHSNNLFCYCGNDPINGTDVSGNLIAKAVGKFVLWAVFGVFAQFVSDLIEFLYKKFISKKNVSFGISPLGDYLGSALSWGMCSLNLFNNKLATFLGPFVPVLVKHLTNIIRGSFSWQALLVDLAAAFIAGIISVALNNSMKNKLNKVRMKSGKKYYYQKYLKKRQKIEIKINKAFFKASITIVVATSLIQLLLNLLLK